MTSNLGPEWENTSVSHDTMRNGDLIPVFIDVLRIVDPITADHYANVAMQIEDMDSESGDALIATLFDTLDSIAPDGTYFGAHPGDGADYGFWTWEDEA